MFALRRQFINFLPSSRALIMGFIGRYRSILRDRVNLYPSRSRTGWLPDPTIPRWGRREGKGIYHARSRSTGHLSPRFGRPRNSDPWLSTRMIGCIAIVIPIYRFRSPRFGIDASLNICIIVKNWDGVLLKEFRKSSVFLIKFYEHLLDCLELPISKCF